MKTRSETSCDIIKDEPASGAEHPYSLSRDSYGNLSRTKVQSPRVWEGRPARVIGPLALISSGIFAAACLYACFNLPFGAFAFQCAGGLAGSMAGMGWVELRRAGTIQTDSGGICGKAFEGDFYLRWGEITGMTHYRHLLTLLGTNEKFKLLLSTLSRSNQNDLVRFIAERAELIPCGQQPRPSKGTTYVRTCDGSGATALAG